VDDTHRTIVATFYAPGTWAARVELGDNAAHHAAVKRLVVGDPVRLTNGAGIRAHGHIDALVKRTIAVEVVHASVERVHEPKHIELWAPVGDRDRMLWLAEKAVELGVTRWRSVMYRRSKSVNPRGEGAAFLEKVQHRMIGALEQSAGAWLPEVMPESTIDAIASCTHEGGAILLDPLGQPLPELMPTVHVPVVLALGPEGGLEPDERAAFIDAGWRAASLGPNILRFETAGVAGVAIVRALLQSP